MTSDFEKLVPRSDETRAGARIPMYMKLLVAWFVIPVAVLGTAEGLARILIHKEYQPNVCWEINTNLASILGFPSLTDAELPDNYLFWVLKPGLRSYRVQGTIPGTSNWVDFRFTTDGSGLRVHDTAPNSNSIRILALGDSCTFGLFVNDNETWPAQLEQKLNRGHVGSFVVRNAGVTGYSSFQGYRYLERYGMLWHPHVVIASFGNTDESTWYGQRDIQVARDLEPTWWKSLLLHSRFYTGIRSFARPPLQRAPTNGPVLPRMAPRETRDMLLKMNRLCENNGAKLVLLLWPYKMQLGFTGRRVYMTSSQRAMIDAANEAHIPLVSLRPIFAASSKNLYLDLVHGSPEGCALAASALADEVVRLFPEKSR
jgi:lysophospholipase L1-like esterase